MRLTRLLVLRMKSRTMISDKKLPPFWAFLAFTLLVITMIVLTGCDEDKIIEYRSACVHPHQYPEVFNQQMLHELQQANSHGQRMNELNDFVGTSITLRKQSDMMCTDINKYMSQKEAEKEQKMDKGNWFDL